MTMNTAVLEAFAAENPIRRLYDEAIVEAQQGRYDNTNKRMRFYTLHQLAEQAILKFPALDLVECGCWHGHSTVIISKLMRQHNAGGRLHVFDSFEGLSRFTESDISDFWTTEEQRTQIRLQFASEFDRMHALCSPYGFVDLYKGWIPHRFADMPMGEVSFVSIDVDLYEPTRDSIAFFFPRLVKGGFMYFDDYAYKDFPGAKKAIDDYVRMHPPSFILEGPAGSAFLIK